MTRLRVDADVVSGVLRGFQSRLEPVTKPTAARDRTTRFKLALILNTFQGWGSAVKLGSYLSPDLVEALILQDDLVGVGEELIA